MKNIALKFRFLSISSEFHCVGAAEPVKGLRQTLTSGALDSFRRASGEVLLFLD